MKKIIFVLLLALIFISACSKQPANNDDIPIIKESNKGVGFMPSSDFKQSLLDADSSGSYIGFYTPMDLNKEIPEIVAVAYEYKLNSEPIVNINFFDASTGIAIKGYTKEKYKNQVISIVKKYKPNYIAVGNEINIYNDQQEAIEIYNLIYDEIKKISSDTKVFTVFQYEKLADKSIINKFKLDAIGITTYPFIKYSSPSDIPDKYYKELSDFNKPIIFSEIGWPGEEAVNFIDVFNDRLEKANIKPNIIIWGLLYDYAPQGYPWNSMGLFDANNKEKPVFTKWTQD